MRFTVLFLLLFCCSFARTVFAQNIDEPGGCLPVYAGNEDFQQALSTIDWDGIKAHMEQKGMEIGYNFVLHGDCGIDPSALAKEIREGLKTAVSCLNTLGPERQKDAASLLAMTVGAQGGKSYSLGATGFWKKPVALYCMQPDVAQGSLVIGKGAVAEAIEDDNENFPGLMINKTATVDPQMNVPYFNGEAFAHELIHLLGYRHDDGVDVPYLMQSCCFQKNSEACDILKKPHNNWQTPEYIKGFTDVMMLMPAGEANIARSAAFGATKNAKNPGELLTAYSDAILQNSLFVRQPELVRSWGMGMPAAIYLKAGELVSGKKDPVSDQVVEKNFPPSGDTAQTRLYMDKLSQALAALIKQDKPAFQRAFKDMQSLSLSACGEIMRYKKQHNGQENFALSGIFTDTILEADALTDNDVAFTWKGPCE